MSEDVRYKMQHLGDIFVDTLSCVVDSAKKHAKGVVLTYDIRDSQKEETSVFKPDRQENRPGEKSGSGGLEEG